MLTKISAVWVPVQDMERAVKFYGETLGLDVRQHDEDWSEIAVDGQTIGLNGRPEETPDGDGGALIAFGTDGDLDDEVARLRDAGVEFTGEVSDHPWGRIAPFKDPDGNDLQVYAPPA